MADDDSVHDSAMHGSTANGPEDAGDAGAGARVRRGPSVPMLLAALAALLVAGWALIGPFSLAFLGAVDLRWAFVVAAGVVGLLLIAGPRRKHRRKRR